MSCESFWAVTPREALATIEAAGWRHSQEHRLTVTGAWFAEAFARTKRLESLQTTLRRTFGSDAEDRAASLEERAEAARGWARRLNARFQNQRQANG